MILSVTYPDLENKFPDAIDNFDRFLDPTLEMLNVINQYYAYYDAGDLSNATALLEANPTLKRMIINAEGLNKQRDAILSLQRFFMDNVQQYIVGVIKPPVSYSPNDKYVRFDVVGYVINNVEQYYWCFHDDTPIGTLPTDTGYFIPITLRGEQGVSGTGLSYRGGWKDNVQYYADDCVAYSNILWSADNNSFASEPTLSSSDWTYVMGIQKQIVLSDMQPTTQIEGDIWYEII